MIPVSYTHLDVYKRQSHTREEWEQYSRQASLESSAAMKPVMEAIAQDFVCYQYDENIPVPYGSDRWDLYFWCNPFTGAAETSERDFSYFTLTFNEDVYKRQDTGVVAPPLG